jgi:hypothetical protein
VVRREHVRLEYGDNVVRTITCKFCSVKIYGMSDLKSMREELRALRKDHVKPVSRMRKGDISSELNRLREMREETPAVASYSNVKAPREVSSVESIREAKASEFPVEPERAKKQMPKAAVRPAPKVAAAKAAKAAPKAELKKKESKLAQLMRLLEAEEEEQE